VRGIVAACVKGDYETYFHLTHCIGCVNTSVYEINLILYNYCLLFLRYTAAVDDNPSKSWESATSDVVELKIGKAPGPFLDQEVPLSTWQFLELLRHWLRSPSFELP
jgi:hypothetical protein